MMKKRILSLTLALCLLLSLLPGTAWAADTPSGTDTHSHKVCGAGASESCTHSGDAHTDAVEWTALTDEYIKKLSTGANNAWVLPEGNYFLAEDIALTEFLKISGTVNLCLNGHKLSNTGNKNGFVQVVRELNLCDCKSTGTIIQESSNSDMNAVWVYFDSTGYGIFNQYGGTIQAKIEPVYFASKGVWNYYAGTLKTADTGTTPRTNTYGKLNLRGDAGALEITFNKNSIPVYIGTKPNTAYQVTVYNGDNQTFKITDYPFTIADGLPAGASLEDCFKFAGTEKLKLEVNEENKVVLRTYNVAVSGSSDVLSCDKDGKLTADQLTAPTPSTNQNQKWVGWYDAETSGSEVTTDTVFNDDGTIYARWEAVSSDTAVEADHPIFTSDGTKVEAASDGTVTITPPSGGTTTTVTPPSGGKVTVGGDGKITVPDGSKVQTDGGPEITVGPDNGGTVDPATGGVTVPNGGKVTIKDDQGNTTTITPPSGGEVKPGADGGVEAPGGSTVKKPDGSEVTVPSGGGTVKPDGSVEGGGDTPAPDDGKLDSGETVNLTGGGTVKRDGDTVTITPSGGGDPTTITVPAGGEVTVDKDTGEVTVPDNSKVKTGDNGTEITLPSGGTVKPGGEVTPAPGGTVTITVGTTTTTITPPSGGSVEPAVDGGVDVPEGTTIQTGTGPVITLPETGDGGTVKPGGEVVGSPVKVGDNTVTVSKTDPTQGDIATDSSGNVTLPGGTTATVEDKDDNKTTVTVPSGGSSGTVSKDGDITLPSGGTVTVPGKDGGTTEITVPSGGTVEKNSDGTLTAPADSEITNKDKNGQQVGDKVTVPSGGQTVTPGGEPAPVNYTVTFQSNGGSAVAAQTVSKGGSAKKPADPTRDGYTFKGWYADAEFNAEWNFSTVLTGDLTLYARWEKNPVIYTVTFDSKGGSAVASKKVTEGKLIEKPASPTKSGYTFQGWTMTKDGSDFWQFATATVRADMTLYAKWEAVGDSTEVKPGSPVTTDDGTKVEDKGDGTVTITPPSSEEGDKPTTVTPPSSGDNVTVDEQGKVNVPGGSTVQTGGGPEITVPNEGGTVNPGTGEITVPGGSTVTVPDGSGGKTEITVPTGGSSTIKPTNDGNVEVPEGSTVTTQDGTKITVTDGDTPVSQT